jgi:aspartyl protease family protein
MRAAALALFIGCLVAAGSAWPQTPASSPAAATRRVAFSGSMGERAVLVIDGQLRTLSPGATERGVRFIGLAGGDAQVEIDGRRALLRLGAGPLALAEAQRGGGSQIVLPAGLGGHFTTSGSINGRPVEFIVDTGATAVSLRQAAADRIGLVYRNGRRGLTQTANGAIPVNFVTLNSVRIGDVEVYNIEAAVMPAPMSHVLLGNSFLTRFQMKRENDTLTLEKRP